MHIHVIAYSIELARLADDGCPNLPEEDARESRRDVLFNELVQSVRMAGRGLARRTAQHPKDSGVIRLW